MVLLKRAIRQRARALGAFFVALLSCGYSPGLEERLEAEEIEIPIAS
jgi:hypothetical protein